MPDTPGNQRLGEEKHVGGTAAAQACDGIQQRFLTDRDCIPHAPKNPHRETLVSGRGSAPASQNRHSFAKKSRSIRHHPDQARSVSEPSVQALQCAPGRDRDKKFLRGHLRTDFIEHVGKSLGLHGQHDHRRLMDKLTIALGPIHTVAAFQQPTLIGQDVRHPKLGGTMKLRL